MEEKREEDFRKEFEDEELDLTKDAFFADMMEMEEEIASEAYELVEHAINLITSQYYDDGIEILRQAIGLYTQINREEEIKAINEKISEVYILKENMFRETEIKEKKEVEETEVIEGAEVIEEVELAEESEMLEETESEADLIHTADLLIVEAHQLVNINKFEEALDKYDEAEKLLEKLDKTDEIERLYSLIEECYNIKANYLKSIKKAKEVEGMEELKLISTEEQIKEEKLEQYLETKKREEEISSKAYEILDKAVELAKSHDYDEAISLYEEGANLFNELNWTYETMKIQDTIEQLQNEKIAHLQALEREKVQIEQKTEIEIQEEKIFDQQVKELEDLEKLEQMERVRGLELQKMEQEFFKAQIDNMVTEASRMAREYELAMQKAIKKGKLVEECIYPKVIEIFKRIKELLIDKGWNKEAAIYDDTIDIYIQKFEQDKKIRQIEADKKKKREEAEELIKIKREDIEVSLSEEQLIAIEKQRQEKMEIQNIRDRIEEMTNRADRLAREYEVALRKGKFELKCPYPEIINIYEEATQMAQERGWNTEVTIFISQINTFKEKLEKDKKLRQIEAEKARKQGKVEEILKIKEEELGVGLDDEKAKIIEEQKRLEEEKRDFDKVIDLMINRAEKMAREYDIAMKKAIKKAELAEHPPFLKIINIYEKIRRMLLEKGRNEEAAVYSNQITFYTQKLEKDNKLREIESQKAEREKAIEEMLKVDKKIGREEEKLKAEEKKKKEEDFEKYITKNVNRAERMVRDFEMAMRKALRKGEILEDTPYSSVIDIYKQLREKVYARGWREQAEIFANQAKIYQEKLEKHEKLFEIEAQKAQREKELEEIHKKGKRTEIDQKKLISVERKKEEKEFQKYITEMINKAEKLEREFESVKKKALKKGKVLRKTPYSDIIKIYKQVKSKLDEKGWVKQSQIYSNQIKIYQEKSENYEKLLEVEVQKAQREKQLEEMHKMGKVAEIDQTKLSVIEKKREEEEFQQYITEMVNKAEKLEREFDLAMKKAIKKGEIIEQTPYFEIIEIYQQLKNNLDEKGWIEQSQIYSNQIKIYQEKSEKHEKLLEVEAQKAQREKQLEEMHKMGKVAEIDQTKLSVIEKKREEEEFQQYITEMINKAEKLEREFDLAMKKAIKKGEIIEQTPYSEIIEIYQQLKNNLDEKGWIEQSNIYSNQIQIYQDKIQKHEKLLKVEAKKVQREKELEDLKKAGKKEIKPAKPEKLKELKAEEKEEDILLDKAMNLIDEAENSVKIYELSIKKDILVYESPYDKAITKYEEAKEIFKKIGWNDEANRLIKTIKFYRDKKEKDDKLREIERRKLEEPEIELEPAKIATDKDFSERQKRLSEFEEKQKLADEAAAEIFNMIQEAERMAQEYEIKLKSGVFDYEAPYGQIIDIYRKARKRFEEINWNEESAKLIETIKFYKEKLGQDKKIRALEAEKAKKREEELMMQQRILEQARQEQEKLLQQRKETLDLKKVRIAQFETQKDKAFRLMDQAKRELRQNNFDKAIEYYQESEKIFVDIKWEEGIKMVRDSIVMISNKKNAYELEQKTIEERKTEKRIMEEKLEEKLAEAQLIKQGQQEEKRKEFLKIQKEREQERQISEEAYQLLEDGTLLMNNGKFSEAYDKYIHARELFQKIFWQREVSRINNDLLFKLKKEQKQAEIFEEIKFKKIEEEKQIARLKEEAKKERLELEKRKKEERKEEAKRELDRKISLKLDNANKLIDSFRYNEGILMMREEIERLMKLENNDKIKRINEQIENLKVKAEIPLITTEIDPEESQNGNFIAAYKALDEVLVSIADKRFKKAISELTEAKFKLKELKFGKKIIKEIDNKIIELKSKVRKKPIKEIEQEGLVSAEEEMDLLRKRIAARREERRKKVLDLLGKSKE